MAKNTQTIKIQSILGGHSQITHFAGEGQFLTSIGINPALGLTDPVVNERAHFSETASGLLRPTAAKQVGSDITGAPKWIFGSPRTSGFYIYTSAGSVYTLTATLGTITGLGDLNDDGSASGNGAAYYDNYLYFARDTTVARYGPLDGTPAFTDDFWVNTLSKTALSNTRYPFSRGAQRYPNHILHRHSDGRLYILDVVDNQGAIHFIKTRKTTVEGDTDDGSTYTAINVGYGLYPTAIESYGSSLVIAFVEGEDNDFDIGFHNTRAKVAFWDTTSDNVNTITWVEYPDQFISAIKNINGILYFTSGSADQEESLRLVRYIGGSTFEEIHSQEIGSPPMQGALDGNSTRLLFGATVENPDGEDFAGVLSYGLQKSSLGQGIFHVHRATKTPTVSSVEVTALLINNSDQFARQTPIVGWTEEGTGSNGIDQQSWDPEYDNSPSEWYSEMFRIGQPFKVTKVRIPLAQALTSNMSVIPSIRTDGYTSSDETVLTTINSTNYGTTRRSVVIRPENLVGDDSFLLKLEWTGSELCVIGLPITIEIELLDVDSTRAT